MADREIMVRLVIQDDGTATLKKVGNAADATEKDLKDLENRMNRVGKERGPQQATTDYEKFEQKIKNIGMGIGVFAAVGMAVRSMTQFMSASVQAAVEEEQAYTALAATMSGLGKSYEDNAAGLQSLFGQIQATTRYSDDEAAGALQKLMTVTGDYDASLKLLQPTLDLASAKQMDLGTAAELLGKAGAGVTTTLQRYGIVIDETTRKMIENADATERAEIITDLINGKGWGGQAQANMASYADQLKQVNNYWSDFKEAVGGAVLGVGQFGSTQPAVVSALKGMTEWVKNFAVSLTELINTSWGDLFLAYLNEWVANVLTEFENILLFLENIPGADKILGGLTDAVGRQIDAALARAGESAEKAFDKAGKAGDALRKKLDGLTTGIKNVADTYQTGGDKTEKVTDAQLTALDKLEKKTKELLAAAKEYWAERDRAENEATLGVLDQTYDQYINIGNAIDLATDGQGNLNLVVDGYGNLLRENKPWEDAFKKWLEETNGKLNQGSVYADLFADSMRKLIQDGLKSIFEGEDLGDVLGSAFETLGEMGANQFADAFKKVLEGGNVWEALSGGMYKDGEWSADSAGGRVQMGLQGAGMVYQGAQQGGGGGALQGAMGGAMAGFSVAGPWGALVGGVIGGLMGYFGGGDDESPWLSANVGPGGALVTDSGGHAGMGEREREAWQERINAAYTSMQGEWRSMLEMFGDPSLFEFVRDDPSLTGLTGDPQALAQMIVETILPDKFQHQFQLAFRHGMESLGMTGERFAELTEVMKDLPGSERLALLTNYITVLQSLNDMMEMSGDLREAATKSPWEAWQEGFEEVVAQAEMFRSGWEDLDLQQQVTQGQKTVDLLSTWYNNAVQYLSQLIQMQEQMQARIESLRERIVMRDMSPGEQSAYAMDQFAASLRQLQGAETPEQAQRFFDEAMRYLEMLEGMDTDVIASLMGYENGSEMLLAMLGDLETTMNTVMGGFQDTIQAQADALYAELELMFENLTGQSGGVGQLDSAAVNATNSVDYLGYAASDAADALYGLAEAQAAQQEALAEAIERMVGRLGRSGSFRDAQVAPM